MRLNWLGLTASAIFLGSASLVVHTVSVRQQRLAERLTTLSHCEKMICEEYTLEQFYKELPTLFPSAKEEQSRTSERTIEVNLQQPLMSSPCFWLHSGSQLSIRMRFRDGVAAEHCEELH